MKPEQVGNSIKWFTAKTEYYDVENGLQIKKADATNKNKYIIIKKNKHVTLNELKTHGTVKHTIECRKQPQGKLFE